MKTLDRLSSYNPLRGLTLDGLVAMIEQGEQGYYADLQWLYRLICRRNATARAVRRKLQGALGKLDWDIKLRDDFTGFDKGLAEKQAAKLREAYENVRNFRRAIVHLAMADIFGFSPLCKVYAGAPGADPDLRRLPRGLDPWTVVELRTVPRWHLCREGVFAPWAYNPDARPINRGQPLVGDWIIREVEDPAAEIFAFAHVKMSVTDADWDQFCDTFAVPPIFIEGPPNVPKGKEGEYQATAESIVADGRGYLPNGSKVHILDSRAGDGSAFTARLRFYREEIVLAGTGGILTTLDGNTGIGKGPAEEHDDTWLDIAAEVGASVSGALNEGFDDPLLDRLFPDQPHLAYFELRKPQKDASATVILADAKAAKDAGFDIDAEEFSEKTGYKLKDAAAPASQPTTNTNEPEAVPSPGQTPPASPELRPDAIESAKPAEEATPPPASPGADALLDAPEPVREVPTAKPGQTAEAKPSLVQAALAESVDVESKWLAPIAERLNRIEEMIQEGASPEQLAAEIEATLAALPDLLGAMDLNAAADAIERALGPAAVQGVRDAVAARRKSTA